LKEIYEKDTAGHPATDCSQVFIVTDEGKKYNTNTNPDTKLSEIKRRVS
jgi:hypothetical protein